MQTLKINVEGMNCNNCAIGLENYLKKSGATDVSVNFATATASFSVSAQGSLPNILKGIEGLGYRTRSGKQGIAISLEHKLYFSLIWTIPLFLHMFVHWAPLHDPYIQLGLCIPVFALGLEHFGRSAMGSLRVGIANMDVLVVIGITAAFIYSLTGILLNLGPDYLFFETTATITSLVLLGNVIEHRSVKKTTSAIGELTSVQARRAQKIVLDPTERVLEIDANDIATGDLLLVNSGDKIPTDGEIIWGEATIDESMISGESIPVEGKAGRRVIGGTIIVKGSIKMKALAVGKDTMLSGMIRLVEEAQQNKPEIQRLGDKVSSIFVPLVLVFACLTLVLSFLVFGISFKQALLSSIAVLVIACPCAMGLATPTAVMVGIGKAAKKGILFKGGATIEQFAGVKNVVFDKTGTLTTGAFKIKNIHTFSNESNLEEIKGLVAGLEKHSSHPIAKSLSRELAGTEPYKIENDVRETRGLGVEGLDDDGNKYELGSRALVAENVELPQDHDVYLLKNGTLIAAIDIKDDIKVDASSTIDYLHALGIQTFLLSGDRKNKCEEVAEAVGINTVYSEKLPNEKLEIIEKLASESPTAFIGDGINDAPSLAKATVGVSLTEASEAAIQSAQIVLLSDTMNHLKGSHIMARHTMRTIKQNLFWAFFYNTLAIPVAAVGLLNPMIAALTMAFSDVMVIGNSLRLKLRKII